MRKAMVLCVVSVLLATAAPAQQFWDKKPYEKWSKDECKRMLNDSPWVQRYGMSVPYFSTGGTNLATGGASSVDITYTAQLRSALPMRQAVVQQAILEAAKQVKDAERLEAMRRRAQQFVNSPTTDIVIVHVIYGSNDANIDRALATYWQQQTTETLRDTFNLVAADGRRGKPIRYEALPGAGREFAVTFPRAVDGKPIVTPEDKALTVEFYHPDVAIGGTSSTISSRSAGLGSMQVQSLHTAKDRIVLQYKVKDMMRGSELVY
jgi:hypothetical protein